MSKPTRQHRDDVLYEYARESGDKTPFEGLRLACQWYLDKKIDKYEFVDLIRQSFADDWGMDWKDERKGLVKLAKLIASAS